MSTQVASARGVSIGVVVAALATAAGALPLLLGLAEPQVPTGALYGAGWPAFGIAAALLLDRALEPRMGRTLAALAVVPTAMVVLALPRGVGNVWGGVEDLWTDWVMVVVLGTLVALSATMGYPTGRAARRRLFWLLLWCAVVLGAVLLAEASLDQRGVAVVITLGMWLLAGLVTRLLTATSLRPVDEPLRDVLAAALTVLTGLVVGLAARLAGTRAGIPNPDLPAAFAAVMSTALAWPTAAWWRRSWLTHRYGTGALSPEDVASITTDLHHLDDAHVMLDKAAEMVAASSGHPDVTLVLGHAAPGVPTGYIDRPLLVGGERVGTLLLRSDDPEGPEPRQSRMVAQLLPTLALVCRAVELAVETEDARQDVTSERDAERARILGDLHDGLGPVLVGMSMRVQAELRRHPTPLLESLAPELTAARADLRRIVSGLTPSALHDANLGAALTRLVDTFNAGDHQVVVHVAAADPLPPEVEVAVYRCVAEGVTNAIRHGNARHVAVEVETGRAGQIAVTVRDDGVGGVIAEGIGLTSLRHRAEHLGGSLWVGPCDAGGVLLHVELPTREMP